MTRDHATDTTHPTPAPTADDPTACTTHRVPTADGRTLAVEVRGPADGPTVVFLQSAPGSRRFDPDPEVTAAAGIRLVTFDRAGYGDSTELPATTIPTIVGHAEDAAAVVASLDVGAVDVVGWSAGGRIAAALATTHPHLVRSVAIVAAPAPDDEVPWVLEEHRAVAGELRQDPAAAVSVMAGALGGLAAAVAADEAAAVAQVAAGSADEALLARRPELVAAVVEMVRTGLAGGEAGLVADIVADQVSTWGFDRGTVGAPTTCWYGGDDGVITPAHGEWWAAGIPDASLTVVPDAGHLVVTEAWADVLAARP